MLTLLINETKPLAGLFASTTGGIGSVPDISVADEGQAVSVQTFTRTAGVITDSFVAGDVLHIGIGDGVNAPVCYIELSSASPATGTMAINTVGMVALFAATSANQLTLNVGVVRTRGGNTNTIFSAPIVIHRSVIDPDTAVPTPSILGTGVAAALKVAINTALGFVRLDASARYPALDGSQITNLAGGSLTVGTTAIASGTTGRILYDNAGVLGELPVGTGVATALAVNVGSAGAFLTSAVTSITGTANEITVTGTTTPTLSLPSALTFTGKTVTGGTFTGGAFNGTVGATTPDTVAGTTGTFSGAVSTSGIAASISTIGNLSQIYTVGEDANISTNGNHSQIYTSGVDAPIYTNGDYSPIYTTNAQSHIYTYDASSYIQTRSTFKLNDGTYTTTLSHAPTADRAIALPNAAGTLALTSDITGGTLAGSFTTLTASATTSILLGTAGSAVGNVGFRNATSGTTTLAPATGALGTGTVTLPLSGTLATLAGAETFTGAKTFSTNPVTLSGNQSRAAWTTTGTGLVQAAASYTDTSSSGTVAVTAINNLAQPTLLASSATTYTDSFVTRMAGPPVASTNVTQTRAHTLGILDSTISNASTDGALVVAAAFGTSATSVGIGGGNISAGGTVLAANFSTTGGIIIGNAANIRSSGSNSTMSIQGSSTQFGTGNVTVLTIGGPSSTNSKSSGQTNVCAITPLYTGQTGTASNTDLLINRTETAIGSGAQLLIDAQVATVSRFSVTNAGNVTAAGTLAVTGATTLTGLLTANGGVTLGDAQNIAFNTTTGTKIGTATTQKLSFWNSTPIVQPTTAVASASVAHAGGGTNIKTDDTFDGYTIAQVVKALRNAGLLA